MGANPVYSASLDLTMQIELTSLLLRLTYKSSLLYDATINFPDVQPPAADLYMND